MENHLHIISHDVPWPADYGGVIDIYYCIEALHALGIRVHLHCFTGKREPQAHLQNICRSVHYYPRKESVTGFSLQLPYIVSSRVSSKLEAELKKDDYPILIEGIHCSYMVYKNVFPGRKIFLRPFNIEQQYYANLAAFEKQFLKRQYYLHESKLLLRYEKIIAQKAPILNLSKTDQKFYSEKLGAAARFLPVFLPWQKITSKPGMGNYCLYHGNLSVNENDKAACWLLKSVFKTLPIPIVIAGKNPSYTVQSWVQKLPHAKLVANPDAATLQNLIENAQVNILPSFNTTGVKLKLLNALFNGRHCLTNEAGVAGSGLESITSLAHNPKSFAEQIQKMISLEFSDEDINKRAAVLYSLYNNTSNAATLCDWFI